MFLKDDSMKNKLMTSGNNLIVGNGSVAATDGTADVLIAGNGNNTLVGCKGTAANDFSWRVVA